MCFKENATDYRLPNIYDFLLKVGFPSEYIHLLVNVFVTAMSANIFVSDSWSSPSISSSSSLLTVLVRGTPYSESIVQFVLLLAPLIQVFIVMTSKLRCLYFSDCLFLDSSNACGFNFSVRQSPMCFDIWVFVCLHSHTMEKLGYPLN